MYEEFGEIINTMKFNSYDYTENITITLNALNDRKNGKIIICQTIYVLWCLRFYQIKDLGNILKIIVQTSIIYSITLILTILKNRLSRFC